MLFIKFSLYDLVCWEQYLTAKIVNEGVCNGITCPENGCDIIVDEKTITNIIKEPNVIEKYQHLITNSFVVTNRFLRWCPSPKCLNAIKVNYPEFIAINCDCGANFCFLCGEKWHEPTRCHLLKNWNKKCMGETSEKIDCETANWILSYTKECPKCNAAIEKNGGCNHMTCRNVSCRHEFCWLCMADWVKHGYQQSCNRFEESEKAQTARSKLQRYIHYWTRFHNHQQSLKSEQKLFEEINTKMEELQLRNLTWVEVQFLKNASEILCKCRQTLMYSYPFAYYLSKNNQSTIFEDNQADLEIITEKLSDYLERDFTQVQDLTSIKTSIIDISKYCDSRRKVLVDHVYEGYDADFWEYQNLE
jgi:ariadne-1